MAQLDALRIKVDANSASLTQVDANLRRELADTTRLLRDEIAKGDVDTAAALARKQYGEAGHGLSVAALGIVLAVVGSVVATLAALGVQSAGRRVAARLDPVSGNRLGVVLHFDTNLVGDKEPAAVDLRTFATDGWITLAGADVVGSELAHDTDPTRRTQLQDEAYEHPEVLSPFVLDVSRLGFGLIGTDDDQQRIDNVFGVLFPGTDPRATSRTAGNKRRDACTSPPPCGSESTCSSPVTARCWPRRVHSPPRSTGSGHSPPRMPWRSCTA